MRIAAITLALALSALFVAQALSIGSNAALDTRERLAAAKAERIERAERCATEGTDCEPRPMLARAK